MAKKSTIETSNTTDLFIEDQLYSSRDYGLSAGEKVAIGFGIAGGAIILGFMIYEGIKYIITRNSYNHYTAIPTQNVNPNLQQLLAQQYAQYVQSRPVPEQPVTPPPAPAPQPQNNTQPVASTQEIVSAITSMSQGIAAIMNTQNTMVSTMQEMVKGISIRNSQEFENIQNENAFLKQQVNEMNMARERAESVANHMQGQYDNLANQVGAPLSREYLNNMYNLTDSSIKYPNLDPNAPTNNIVR